MEPKTVDKRDSPPHLRGRLNNRCRVCLRTATECLPHLATVAREPISYDTEPTTATPLTGLTYSAFQHPDDRAALNALQRIPLLPQVARSVSAFWGERRIRSLFLSSAVRVTSRQYPSLHTRYMRLAKTLDIKRIPELFIKTDASINAYAIGKENYFIVVNTALMDILTDDELDGIIGHELGHVKCEHMLYQSMGWMLRQYGTVLFDRLFLGAGKVASEALKLALLSWSRSAEFTCDRAALLATQEKEPVCTALSKLAGFSRTLQDDFSIEEFMAQADEVTKSSEQSIVSRIADAMLVMNLTHPFTVSRVAEISQWANSQQYRALASGDYTRYIDHQEPPTPNSQVNEMLAKGVELAPHCDRCDLQWPVDSEYCGMCGDTLTSHLPYCQGCNQIVDAMWKVCPQCGNRLQEP